MLLIFEVCWHQRHLKLTLVWDWSCFRYICAANFRYIIKYNYGMHGLRKEKWDKRLALRRYSHAINSTWQDTVFPVRVKVWTTENTVGFNPETRRGQVGRYCIKLSHKPVCTVCFFIKLSLHTPVFRLDRLWCGDIRSSVRVSVSHS